MFNLQCSIFIVLNAGRKFTPAILLIIEMIVSEQLVPAILKPALAPVLIPKDGSFDSLLRQMTGAIDLLQTLPARGGQRRGEIFQS